MSEKPGCSGQCSQCTSGAMPPSDAPAGGRLVAASAGAFLAPIALAIAGAKVVSGGAAEQFAGAVAGLMVGVAGAAIVGRLARRRGKGSCER